MKLIYLIFLIGGSLIACVNNNQEAKVQDPIQPTYVETQDSLDWFREYLDIYIEKHLFTFSPTKYVNPPTDEVKSILSLDSWLGSFTISDMTSDKNLITINCSNEEQDFNKFIYITPDCFVITLYTVPNHGVPIGSSIIYQPDQNKLQDLEGIVITKVSGNRIEGSREYYSEQEVYVTQYGHYNLESKKFIVDRIE